ncbi:hypothetical protein [Aquidulcibacter sp.]|uniref:hypothetical protein n=1 Tax=Aquidulcibacter sp. TaxID=2052990 RepID=UPI003BA53D5E
MAEEVKKVSNQKGMSENSKPREINEGWVVQKKGWQPTPGHGVLGGYQPTKGEGAAPPTGGGGGKEADSGSKKG